MYTVSQLRRFYADMFGKSKRSIDIKAMLEDRFDDKLVFVCLFNLFNVGVRIYKVYNIK